MKQGIHVLSRAVIIEDNHILLAYDPSSIPKHYYELNKKFYYLPGGHINFQESATDAIHREIREELNKEIHIIKLLATMENAWSFPGDDVCCHTHEINFIFHVQCFDCYKNIIPQQQEDHVAFHWQSLDSIDDIDLRPCQLKSLLPKWLKSSQDNIFISAMNENI